jgi:hypothetical protein
VTPAEQFYAEVAEILGTTHDYREPKRRTRWNARQVGNGRFPGWGLVRLFGDAVLVCLRRGPPPLIRRFASREEALEFLRQLRRDT